MPTPALSWPFGVTAAPYLCPPAPTKLTGLLQAEHFSPPCFSATSTSVDPAEKCPPQSHGAARAPRESSWVWGESQHAGTAAPGAAPAAAHPFLSAKRVGFEHWCFWQLPAAKERAQTHPTAQLVSSYLQVINKSFTVYCNHSAKTQTESICSHYHQSCLFTQATETDVLGFAF